MIVIHNDILFHIEHSIIVVRKYGMAHAEKVYELPTERGKEWWSACYDDLKVRLYCLIVLSVLDLLAL